MVPGATLPCFLLMQGEPRILFLLNKCLFFLSVVSHHVFSIIPWAIFFHFLCIYRALIPIAVSVEVLVVHNKLSMACLQSFKEQQNSSGWVTSLGIEAFYWEERGPGGVSYYIAHLGLKFGSPDQRSRTNVRIGTLWKIVPLWSCSSRLLYSLCAPPPSHHHHFTHDFRTCLVLTAAGKQNNINFEAWWLVKYLNRNLLLASGLAKIFLAVGQTKLWQVSNLRSMQLLILPFSCSKVVTTPHGKLQVKFCSFSSLI